MRRRIRSEESGYVSVYVALVTSLVLVPILFFLIDLGTMAYYKVKLKNTADAVAIAAVAESSSWHIPIPTQIVGYVPVQGVLVNGIHLKNLSPWGAPKEKLQQVANLNQDELGLSIGKAQVIDTDVLPIKNIVSPIMYVKIPVEAKVQLQTPYIGQILGNKGGVTIRAQSCAVAWYRPDKWFMPWDLKNAASVANLVEEFYKLIVGSDEPQKYYRLINCVDSFDKVLSLLEIGLTEHLDLLYDNGPQTARSKRMKKAREEFKDGPPKDCQSKTCVGEDKESYRQWGEGEVSRNKAEEEAEKARQEAIRKAQEAQKQHQ